MNYKEKKKVVWFVACWEVPLVQGHITTEWVPGVEVGLKKGERGGRECGRQNSSS